MLRETEISSQAASVPICNTTHVNLVPSDDRDAYLSEQMPLPAVGAIYDGLLQTSRYNILIPSCPSGNCTFPTYQSLGFCNKCIDISDEMRYEYAETEMDCATGLTQNKSAASLGESSFPCKAELPGYGVSLNAWNGLMNSTVDVESFDEDLLPISRSFIPPVTRDKGHSP